MSEDIYENTWASLVVWVKDIIRNLPSDKPQFIDWEAHGTTPELPDTDLMGPLSLSITEYDDGLFQVTFAIGVSTYATDEGLPRQRHYINTVFNAMRSQKKVPFYDHNSAEVQSVIQMLPGTTVAPLTEITVRPFQYVQGTGLIVPLSEKN